MRQRRSRGWTFKRKSKKGWTWYVGYYVPGGKKHVGANLAKCPDVTSGRATECLGHTARVREVAGATKTEATALLDKRMREIDGGKWAHPAQPLTFDDLLELVKADWRARGRKSSLTAKKGKEQAAVRRLRAFFGRGDARNITAAPLDRYMNERLDAGSAVSTVRNDLNIVKHAMSLAVKKDLLDRRPAFPTLEPKTVRTGFFEQAEFDALVPHLPEHARTAVKLMYWTGWRRNEVSSRQWRHVDLAAGVIRLEPGETKNGKGREFPYRLIPELAVAIEWQRTYTDEVQRRTGQVVPWLFHKEGRRLQGIRGPWKKACKAAGIARIPHDCRRTAVRNLVRAGVSEKIAMELTGHLTRSVFDRYNITNAADRENAVAKLAAAQPDRQTMVLAPKQPQMAAG